MYKVKVKNKKNYFTLIPLIFADRNLPLQNRRKSSRSRGNEFSLELYSEKISYVCINNLLSYGVHNGHH